MNSHGLVPDVPQVAVLGDTVLLRGPAAVDAYRVIADGIKLAQSRDGISPPPRLRDILAACKLASQRYASMTTPDVTEVRSQAPSAGLRSGEVIGVEEVAHMAGVGVRRVRHLAPSLGGWKSNDRGRPWQFDAGLVRTYISELRRIQ